jgi:hypothetical protein
MFPGVKIVAIDDELTELERLIDSLRQLGLACISYNYPSQKPSDETDTSGLRLLFIDINLIGGSSPGNHANTLNAAMRLINQLIKEDNGPYALITWSSTNLHDELIERISQNNDMKDKQPFYSRALSKAEHMNSDTLKEEIEAIFSENKPFGALLDWERRVTRAGETILKDMQKYSNEFSGDSPSEKMDGLLSKLAVDAFGQNHVEGHRFEAVNEALFPIVNDTLHSQFSNEPDASSTDLWNGAITRHSEKITLNSETVNKLNKAVLLEVSGHISPSRRGAILEIPEAWSESDAFTENFGAPKNQIRGNQFKLDKPRDLKWILVQTQAACDFAQGKSGLFPYFLGAIIPEDFVRKKRDGEPLPLSNSIWISPTFAATDNFSNKNFHLEIIHNIVTYITNQRLETLNPTVLGRIKDQLIEDLSHAHHSHGSRPGYVSFR